MAPPEDFRPALLVVDVQEDFCPPDGALAVPDGRAVIPPINALLALPFHLALATKDDHPPDHVSFASVHPGASPYTSTRTIADPSDPAYTYEVRLWPTHCVRDTPGNGFAAEFDAARVQEVFEKGADARVEALSAFRAPVRPSAESAVAKRLSGAGVRDVFVVGLAGEYCVETTALDCAQLGWRTYVVEEGVRSVGGEEAWKLTVEKLKVKGVQVVRADGEEVGWVKALAASK